MRVLYAPISGSVLSRGFEVDFPNYSAFTTISDIFPNPGQGGTKDDLQYKCNTVESKKPINQSINRLLSGMDGTRTRDPVRDRHVF